MKRNPRHLKQWLKSAEIAALKKELITMREKDKENDITTEVASLLNTSKNIKNPNNENMSVARQVMAIFSRRKKDE